jgi:hypothetical protein
MKTYVVGRKHVWKNERESEREKERERESERARERERERERRQRHGDRPEQASGCQACG